MHTSTPVLLAWITPVRLALTGSPRTAVAGNGSGASRPGTTGAGGRLGMPARSASGNAQGGAQRGGYVPKYTAEQGTGTEAINQVNGDGALEGRAFTDGGGCECGMCLSTGCCAVSLSLPPNYNHAHFGIASVRSCSHPSIWVRCQLCQAQQNQEEASRPAATSGSGAICYGRPRTALCS